jgi:ATP-dependent Clp protease ATP-binding subunit ClpA
MTDSLQRKIDFTNTIIISTSNAGYKIILKAFKEKKELHLIKQELLDYIFNKAIFRPELINRFDAFVLFQSLSKENLVKIAELRFKKLQKNLSRKQITLSVSNKAKMKIVELSYNPQFGAREMRRVIQDKIENELARSFLANEIKEGDIILIDDDFKINVMKS